MSASSSPNVPANTGNTESTSCQCMPLTFGIEIEAFLVFPTSQADSYLEYFNDYCKQQGLPPVTTIPVPHRKSADDYKTWQLTTDSSLFHPRGAELSRHLHAALPFLAREGVDAGQPLSQQWSIGGLELVSAPTPCPALTASSPLEQDVFRDMRAFYAALAGRRDAHATHAAFVDASCAAHVHVGRPDNAPFPLGVLKHLALVHVVFEDVISSLHPLHRRPYPRRDGDVSTGEMYAQSNRVSLTPDRHICRVNAVQAARRIFATRSIPELCVLVGSSWYVTERVHDIYNDDDDDKVVDEDPHGGPRLLHTPLAKMKIVRYQNMPWRSVHFPRTLEFRQATGTLDPAEAAHWVHFITGLVRLAERLAAKSAGGDVGDGDMVARGVVGRRATLGRLLDLMEFQGEVRAYWVARRARLHVPLQAHQRCRACMEDHEDELRDAARAARRLQADSLAASTETAESGDSAEGLAAAAAAASDVDEIEDCILQMGNLSLAGVSIDDLAEDILDIPSTPEEQED